MGEDAKSARTQVLIAIIGLMGVLGAALFTNWDKIFPSHQDNTSQKSSSSSQRTPSQTEKASGPAVKPPSKDDATEPKHPSPAYTVLNHGTVRIPLRAGVRLFSYDFERSQQLPECSGDADFFFKPDQPDNPDTKIGVVPCFKATYAPSFLNRRPWDVPANEFISGKGTSISQRALIPCRTGRGNYCQFGFTPGSNAYVVLTFTVFSGQ